MLNVSKWQMAENIYYNYYWQTNTKGIYSILESLQTHRMFMYRHVGVQLGMVDM